MNQQDYDDLVPLYERNQGIIQHDGSIDALRRSLHVADSARMQGKLELSGRILDHVGTFKDAYAPQINTTLSEIRRRCQQGNTSQRVLQVVGLPIDKPEFEEVVSTTPTLLVKTWNFTRAVAWNAWNGFPRSSKKEIERRFDICRACEHLSGEHCQLCGCKCELKNHLMNKLAMKTATCPIQKW